MRPIVLTITALLLSATAWSPAFAQNGYYYPYSHRQATGVNGRVSALTRPAIVHAIQPVRVSLPTEGRITFYAGSPDNAQVQSTPAQPGMVPGHVYRLRISDMPEFPGVELYPTIELLDRLHPPQGLAQEFPIPIEITEEEIEIALRDQMVTKVIYLEQPDLANPIQQVGGVLTEDVRPTANLLQVADMKGRPMAILRIGGRIPDRHSATDEFYSRSPLFWNRGP
ncbi:MAG: hypothetical protein KDA80_06185 [Planctomycetaceae bacterium]|nr:hypothetical protein [Planctomycetaceae bacterium]